MLHRPLALLTLTAAITLGGCGGDDGGDDSGGGAGGGAAKTSTSSGGARAATGGGREGAEAFKDCFRLDGYKAQILGDPTGAAALLANAKGYPVTAVFLNAEKGALYSATVTFFESEAKKDEATRKLNLDFGSADVPEPDERGAAVVEYTAKPARPATRDAILSCLD